MSLAQQIGDNILTLGDSGTLVLNTQLALKKLGFGLTGTGYFGNATDTAVRAFQRKAGLEADGDIGAKTAAALDAAIGAGASPITPDGHHTNEPVPNKVVVANIGRPLWLEAGLQLVGVHEGQGAKDNPEIIDWAKDEGGEISAEYTHDSIPWCALFANHCLRLADLKGTGSLWALDFANPKKWPAVRLPGPAVGAFAPMLRSGGGHIIIVAGKDQHGNIMGLGGNQSDQVSVVPFALSRLNQGFWWPASVARPANGGMASLPVVLSNGQVSHSES